MRSLNTLAGSTQVQMYVPSESRPRRHASFAFREVSRKQRQGAVLVEGAVLMSVFLTLVLGMLELGLVVSRYNMLSAAARQGSREATVHGDLAPPKRAAWGPNTYTGSAADATEIAQAVRPLLAGIDPGDVSLVVAWPDGGNAGQMRVQVTLVTTHRPILTALFSNQEFTLTATSTMLIAH